MPLLSTAVEQMYRLLLKEKNCKKMFGKTRQDSCGTQKLSSHSCSDPFLKGNHLLVICLR